MFFGDGPLTLANGERNPLARGVLITDATVGLVRDGDDVRRSTSPDSAALVGFDRTSPWAAPSGSATTPSAPSARPSPSGTGSVAVIFTGHDGG